MKNFANKNEITLIGKFERKDFSVQTLNNGKIFKNNLLVERLSGTVDRVLVGIWDTIFKKIPYEIGEDKVQIKGSILSYTENGRSYIFVLASEVSKVESQVSDENTVCLEGEIQNSSFRITPFGRKILDIKLISIRKNGKFSIVHSIAWGENAERLKNVEPGTAILAQGRLQSRTYQKIMENGLVEEREINEFSINTYKLL